MHGQTNVTIGAGTHLNIDSFSSRKLTCLLASSSALQGVKVCWQTDLLTGISAPDETL